MKIGDLVRRLFISPDHKERYERFNPESDLGIVVEVHEESNMVVVVFNGSNQRMLMPSSSDHLEIINESR